MTDSLFSRYHQSMTYHCRFLLIPALLVGAKISSAALPLARLDRVVPAGIVRGGSVEIALEGGDLEGVTKLHFSDDRITAEAIEGGKFRVSVPAEVPLGLVDVRAVGTWGVSNPRTMVIAQTASTIEVEPNNLIEQANPVSVGSAVEGVLGARADVDYFVVTLEANQKVIIDLQAERLDSAVDGVLTLFAPDGRAIELSNGYVGKDPRIDLVAPMAGAYRIRVHDLVYNGGAGYFYRLIVHQDPVVDYAYPPVVTRGGSTEIELFGRNLPGSAAAEGVITNGRPLERIAFSATPPASNGEALPIETFLRPRSAREEAFRVSFADGPGTLVGVTDVPVVKEVEPNDAENQSQSVNLPVDVVGRLDRINDADVYRFHGTKDQLIEIAGVSERIGSPADLSILLRRITAVDAATGQLTAEDVAEFDDDAESVGGLSYITSSHDPVARVALPVEGDYLLIVRDRFAESRGDGRFVYHVRLGPPVPDFQLLIAPVDPSNPSSLLVRSGGTTDAVIYALRRGGFSGEIQVSAEGLPAGVTASPVIMGPGVNQVAMVFHAAPDTAEVESRLQVKGVARIGDSDVVRPARAGAIIYPAGGNAPRPARLARSVVLAVRPGAPYLLTAQPDFTKLGQGSMLDLGLALERRSPDFGDKLVGVTVPMAPGTFENAAIEIPAGQNAGRLSLYVKPETPPGRYSVSVKGVAAIPFTKTPADPNAKKNPVEVADPSPPIEITIVPRPAEIAPATAEPTGKPGQQIALAVKVNRQNGYAGPIELSLRLPPGLAGVLTPTITLPADVSEANVPIQLASDLAVGDKGGISVRGTAKVGSDIIPVDARIVLKVVP